MKLESALSTPGWMEPEELAYLAHAASAIPRWGVIAEIGSWRGRSAIALADNTAGSVYCVDTWSQGAHGMVGWWTPNDSEQMYSNPDWLWNEFRLNVGSRLNNRVFPYRLTSLEAAEHFREEGCSFDLIFIDADHTEEALTKDILAWRPLLTKDGILCGHDYGSIYDLDVPVVVDRLIPHFRLVGTIWTTEAA
jgi:hypothetical protein